MPKLTDDTLLEQQTRIMELEEQLVSLQAHCNRQSFALRGAKNKLPKGAVRGLVAHVYESTPKQSLAKHDAEVVREAIEYAYLYGEAVDIYPEKFICILDNFANKLEAGEL